MKTWILVAAMAVAVPQVALVSSAVADGAGVFKAQCAKCHGETGQSDTAAGKAMKVPQLAGDAKVAGASVDELVKSIHENKKHASFIKKISDPDITDAAGYVKELAGKK